MSRLSPCAALLFIGLAYGCSEPMAVPDENQVGSRQEHEFEPVILTGQQLPALAGLPPGELVGFRYTAGSWVQIPVQADERARVAIGGAYNGLDPSTCSQPGWCSGVAGAVVQLYYTDPNTHIGPDPDATFDADDELVFMARDAGSEAPEGAPRPGRVVPGAGVKVSVSESGSADRVYVYLFRHDGGLAPGAGKSYVGYDFRLLSGGGYLATYDRAGTSPDAGRRVGDAVGANPENTTVTTPYYSQHFSDRWILDGLRITAGSASGIDILDRYKTAFAPGNCGRTEYTGSRSEGAFVVNRSGPIRAIRSYLGFNSGPLVQREHIFYERYADVTTFLRVHAIPGILDFFDYSPSAVGMVYRNNNNPQGLVIDGRPDGHRSGPLDWESVQGTPGTMVTVHTLETNIAALARTSFYDDAATSEFIQCTGDNSAFGASGNWITSAIPNTDPRLAAPSMLTLRRQMLFEAPDVATEKVERLVRAVREPLEVRTAEFPAR
jgi:hypothetical protein